jgi:hypothetical protein
MTTYKELRAAGKSMHAKVVQFTRNLGFDPIKIARRMTLPMSGQTLIFDDETAQNAFFDFWFHEYQAAGRSLVESVDPVMAGLTDLETKVFEAHRQSRTSLFQMEDIRISEHQVRMRDLLEPEQPEFFLTDLGMSESFSRMKVRAPLFFRLLKVDEVRMSSGFFFVFSPLMLPALLPAYRQHIKFVPPADLPQKRFVFFFQRYQVAGVEQQYQDVV